MPYTQITKVKPSTYMKNVDVFIHVQRYLAETYNKG